MPALDAFVSVAASLPAMPEVAQKLIRSFDRDDLSLRELSDLVARDNTLAAKVLRSANSAPWRTCQRGASASTRSSGAMAASVVGASVPGW